MSHSNPEFAVLANIMTKLETRNEELRAKELRLRKQLQETKQQVSKRSRPKSPSPQRVNSETESESSFDEETIECPRKCWSPPSVSDIDTSSECSDANLEECPYRPQFVPSDISISQSVSDTTSVDSLQSVDIPYLHQLEVIVADEKERIERLQKLQQRERDIIRTAEVTRAVVDELQEIFNEGAGPKRRCHCMRGADSFPNTTVPPPTPVEPRTPTTPQTPGQFPTINDVPEPPAEGSTPEPQQQESKPSESATKVPANAPTHTDSVNANLHSESMDLWTKTIAHNEGIQAVISKHRASVTTNLSDRQRSQHTSGSTRGQTTLKASVFVPTKTDYRVLQNDDPYRVASKVSRLPSLNDIPESRQHSLAETELMTTTPDLKTITDVLAGQSITPENAPLVCQNLSETKRRLSFMIEHSDECKNCDKFIRDHLKAIDQQLTALSFEFEVQHFSGPVPGSTLQNSIMPAPHTTESYLAAPLGPTSTNLFVDRNINLITNFGESAVSDMEAGPASMETIMRHTFDGHRSDESTWMDAHAHQQNFSKGVVAMETLPENQNTSKTSTTFSITFLDGEAAKSTVLPAGKSLTNEPSIVPLTTPEEGDVIPDASQITTEPGKSKSVVSNDEEEEVFDVELRINDVTYVVDHDDQSLLNEVMADIEEVVGAPLGTEAVSFVPAVKEHESETSEETPVLPDDVTETSEETPVSPDDVTKTSEETPVSPDDVTKTSEETPVTPNDVTEILDEVTEVTNMIDDVVEEVVESPKDDGEGTLKGETVDVEATVVEVPASVTVLPEVVDLTNEVTEAESTGQGEVVKAVEVEDEDVGEVFYDSLEVLEDNAAEVKPPEVTQEDVDAHEDSVTVLTIEEPPYAKLEEPHVSRVRFSLAEPEVLQELVESIPSLPEPSRTVAEPPEPARALAEPPEPSRTVAESPEPARALAEPPEPGKTTPEQDAEIALLQQVFLDQTNQIRTLLDLVKQIPILKPPDLCVCHPCIGDHNTEKIRQELKDIEDTTNITPQ